MNESNPIRNLAEKKYRQLICENSDELREFERQLQTAYNSYMLQISIAVKEADRQRDLLVQKQEARIQEEKFYQDEQRIKCIANDRLQTKLKAANELKEQIREKQRCKMKQQAEEELERAMLDQEKLQRNQKEKEEQEEKQRLKLKLAEEQKAFAQRKAELQRASEMAKALDEQKIKQMAVDYAARDRASIEQRQKYLDAKESLKEQVAQQLYRLTRLKEEHDSLLNSWLIAEKEKAEDEKWKLQEAMHQFKRMHIKQLHEDSKISIENRKKEKDELKQLDNLYAETIERNLALDMKNKQDMERRKREDREAVKVANNILIKLRQEKKQWEQQEELLTLEAMSSERQQHQLIIQQERLALLKSLPPDIVTCLPKGCLTEEDLLLFNIAK